MRFKMGVIDMGAEWYEKPTVFSLKRSLFHWRVGGWGERMDYEGPHWYTKRRFLNKEKAIAYMVQLQLEGYKVRW